MAEVRFKATVKLVALFFCLTAIVAAAVIFYLHKKYTHFVDLPMINCDLRNGPCRAELQHDEFISLKITPTNMPVLTSVMLEVRTPSKLPIKNMSINFKGKEMNMGEFSYQFQSDKKGVYTAQTVLPTCIHDEMVWQAILSVSTQHTNYTVPFLLINEKPKKLKS